MSDSRLFLNGIIEAIGSRDRLHSKKIAANLSYINEHHAAQFYELLSLVYNYFKTFSLSSEKIAGDYLKMINDMRKEGVYFFKHGKYRCANQNEAYEAVYSKADIMSYYMNALLISQILWKHHFRIFVYFEKSLRSIFTNKSAEMKILDVGPGHGFFSFLVKKYFEKYSLIDIADISETSLQMTKTILGTDGSKITYFKGDIFDYDDSKKYDLILLGEVIEHLDKPGDILRKLSNLLNDNGVLWITTPTNSPAIDHVYLFKSNAEVIKLVEDSQLRVVEWTHIYAEDVDDATAEKNKITDLVGLFCKKAKP